MRPKKDPNIRRERFVDVAADLFLQDGYEGVSIKAVLNAVGDRTASPSVFYYYFSNKDELYRAAVEKIANSYVSGFEKLFADDSLSPNEQLRQLIGAMHKSLTANRKFTLETVSAVNRTFILDMKEQVSASFAEMWERFLARSGLIGDQDPKRPALFISGGISALLMDYMTQAIRSEEAERALVREIVLFSAAVLGLKDIDNPLSLQGIL